jgi:hypothetical protein
MTYLFIFLWLFSGGLMLLIDLMDAPEVSRWTKFWGLCFYFVCGPFSRLIIEFMERILIR